MKNLVRIATEQYEFIELTTEGVATVEQIESAVRNYHDLRSAYKASMVTTSVGIPKKDFDCFLENQALGNNKNHMETYQLMSPEQQMIVQCNKRLFARLKSRRPLDDEDFGGGPGKGENGDYSNMD